MPDLEPPLLGVEPLLGQLAPDSRRLDSLLILLEPDRRVAHLSHGGHLEAAQPRCRLVAFQPRPGERSLARRCCRAGS